MEISEEDHLNQISDFIVEAKSAYTLWKSLNYSRSVNVVGEKLAHKYVSTYNSAPAFFSMVENFSLLSFVVSTLYAFDKNPKSYSLYKIDSVKTEEFYRLNKNIFDSLKTYRDKFFAHKDISFLEENKHIKIPSIDFLDRFFNDLYDFYNSITANKLGATTYFHMSTDQLLRDFQVALLNVRRGELLRSLEIEREYGQISEKDFLDKLNAGLSETWERDEKRISKVFKAED